MMPYSRKFAKKAKIKKNSKNEVNFFGSMPWLKSHQPPLIFIYTVAFLLLHIKFKNRGSYRLEQTDLPKIITFHRPCVSYHVNINIIESYCKLISIFVAL